MRDEETGLVPGRYRIAQHLYRMIAYVSEPLTFEFTFPRHDLVSEEFNQTFLTVCEILLNLWQFFASYQNAESCTRQIEASGVDEKRPRLDQRVEIITAMKFLLVTKQYALNIVCKRDTGIFVRWRCRESPAALEVS